MSSKKNPASDWKVYCIIDGERAKRKDLVKIARRLFEKGIKAVQFRHKNRPSYEIARIAKRIEHLAKMHKGILLINDRPDVAFASGASGVHLGWGDISLSTSRRILGKGRSIGKTAHSLKEAKAAEREKADYIGAGPVYKTPVKRDLRERSLKFIGKVKKHVSVPVLAIGGINRYNAGKVLKKGADGVCLLSAACDAEAILKIAAKRQGK